MMRADATASTGCGRNLNLFLDQLAQDRRDLSEFNGLIKEEIRSSDHAFLAILRVSVVRAHEDLQVGVVHANRAENVETAAPGHLQVKNEGVRLHFLNAFHSLRHVGGLSHELRSRYVLQ